MVSSLLVANRGEIARRIVRTARRMGLRTVAVFTEADRSWPHWREADEAVLLGAGPAAESYLSIERILEAARGAGADAIHPGYGFLAENAAFAEACRASGILFIGPPAPAIRAMGSKSEAKRLMVQAGVPVVPGYHGERQEPGFLRQKAYEIGCPLLVKAVAGGGGRGMRRVDRAVDFDAALESARREALAAFGDDRVLLERYVRDPRHVEVQVLADSHGATIHLGDRDCSLQRRHQKIVEEAPAPGLAEAVRSAMGRAAVAAAEAVGYQGAGTVEFVVGKEAETREGGFFFLEMNTRLQVEHPVTEMVTGLDLVEWQIRIASGERLPLRQEDVELAGHAVETRVYAEDPKAGFRPSTGTVQVADYPAGEGVRVDAGAEAGSVVGPFYDSMLAKVVAHGRDRAEALDRLRSAVAQTRIAGPKTNLAFLGAILAEPEFAKGGIDTGFLDRALPDLRIPDLPPAAAAGAIEAHLAAAAAESARGMAGPWARTDGFELGGYERRQTLVFDLEGVQTVAEVVWRGGAPAVASLGGEAPPPDAAPVDIVWAGSRAFLLAAGAQLAVAFPDPLDRSPDEEREDGSVYVPMHGRIVQVSVAEGDRVEKGDPLVTVEAMKMEHVLAASAAGSVEALHVRLGEQVEEGRLAVRIGPAGPAASPERAEPVNGG
ncbi:biotin carboxylase N-terminal domain-containing protein [Propylenella binzhouense]|uniref:Biotin/lipoyl-binding protein n=1 Tax=Propylenella binzhouense TaxID=2555902 RepID=A0A964WSP1_9HYPH|nr:biotin carboxylase N-terminal domain-containing protein [Propylenella binzhouense]MYZ47178.1 biotin/lipoyl-binding protein [Propylenella binzhouense]